MQTPFRALKRETGSAQTEQWKLAIRPLADCTPCWPVGAFDGAS